MERQEQRPRAGEAWALPDKRKQCVVAGELAARWECGGWERRSELGRSIEGFERSLEDWISMSWAPGSQGGF